MPFSEDRSSDPASGELIEGILCDLKGNMRELISSCQDGMESYRTCSDGWGWKGDPTQLDQRIKKWNGGDQNDELGLRLIKVYQAPSQ